VRDDQLVADARADGVAEECRGACGARGVSFGAVEKMAPEGSGEKSSARARPGLWDAAPARLMRVESDSERDSPIVLLYPVQLCVRVCNSLFERL